MLSRTPFTHAEKVAWEENVAKCGRCEKYRFKSDIVVLEIEGHESEVCSTCAKIVEGLLIGRLADKHKLSEDAALFLARKYRSSVATLDNRQNKYRRLTHTVTLDYLFGLYVAQNGLCALTGRKMALESGAFAASIDRIRNSLGYDAGNLHWVCSAVNMMKGGMSIRSFGDWCAAVVVHSLKSEPS